MMVRRLADPSLTPTSQEAGTSQGNAAAMTAPGSEPGIPPAQSGPAIPVSTQDQPGGQVTPPVRWNPEAGVETRGGS
ncbi:MAG TPA: hypothetical protein VF506_10905 [Streptosporangiaceae bacterium]